MSEEILKRGYDKKGESLGHWELFTIGETTINQLKKFNIVPKKAYGSDGRRQPDEIVVDRRNGTPEVIAVIEFKSPSEFDSEKKKLAAVEQCVSCYCKPLGAKIGIVTDRTEYIWINPQHESGYEIATREDGYQLVDPFNPKSDPIRSELIIKKCLDSFSRNNSQITKSELRNPSELADKVWQTIWLASGENPDVCLSTFVEIFLFKYLSDLGVLTYNNDGVDISFEKTISIPDDRIFNFYYKNVRPYIKEIFPADESDGTSVINGIVLDPNISEHNFIFKEILDGFKRFGELKNIDPEFKSRLYENFLKKSLSQKNWGQFFTPRNVVKAMIEMSGLKSLPSNSRVCDPACGVGGFLLESINTVRPKDYIFKGGRVERNISYFGTDRDKKTIILAKANMLIHMNEIISDYSKFPQEFAKVFNETFKSCHNSILGSLSLLENECNDLVLTNPPYVVTGTSTVKKYISENSELSEYYRVNGSGIEGLFIEKIVNSLKPGGKAFIVVPDGLFNRLSDEKLRSFILQKCVLLGVISLPKNTFYTTPKKTYILCIKKKNYREEPQNDFVFTYIISNTGETLDSHRFECDNDFPDMVKNFKIFCADPESYQSSDLRCKVWPISKFNPNEHWSIDRWWKAKERIALGIDDEKTITDPLEFSNLLEKHKILIESLSKRLENAQKKIPKIENYIEVELSNQNYFFLSIGKRVLKQEVYNSDGDIPVYSANVKEPFGFMSTSNLEDFTKPYVLWGIDGNFEFSVKLPGEKFRSTDHCGTIRIEREDINPLFIYYALHAIREENKLDRELRANLKNVKKFCVRIPVLVDEQGEPKSIKGDVDITGTVPTLFLFDTELQQKIVDYYTEFEEVKHQIYESANHINILEMETIEH
ncbi:N-6 DNA methylase [Vibrio parahaemolyticus]|uniref:N-6 DNA methylase n=1 Tax=Gammaproteobacteria TaxID=1236 RepID=UPI00029B50BA|nr:MULTISPECIES: N-6 DNA methylase [Gammaproteobacteria]MBE4030162.1 N-6 DNA methylase [Vibrio parahaemolyticus]MBY7922263.1 N-6 DNA methylase [Vibrio fluvialis]MBY7978099.1 N-6 DNA methylase [Vibrio fluvialis]MCE7641266.1 N-6 DNA methylase [Vibrio fluvialis]